MARYIPLAVNVTQSMRNHMPRTFSLGNFFILENNFSFFRGLSASCHCRGSRRVFSTRLCSPAYLYNFSSTSHTTLTCLVQKNVERHVCTLTGGGKDVNVNDNQRMFSTSPNQASRDSKRRGSIIGHFNSIDYMNKKKIQQKLKEARLKISRRVGNIGTRLLVHNKKIHEKLSDQRAEDVFDRRIKGPLGSKSKRENIKTIPNLLTTLRMASAPLLSYLVVSDYFGCALTIFVLAGLTDMLDGYIARNFKNQKTAFGTALDPLADKLLISFLTVSLTMNGLIPVPVTVLILGRDAGLVLCSFYIRYMSLAPPKTLSRYFDFSLVTAKLYPSNISKINTSLQLAYVASSLAAPVFDFVGSPWLQLLMYTTATTTFLSGADYMFTWRRRLKIIKDN